MLNVRWVGDKQNGDKIDNIDCYTIGWDSINDQSFRSKTFHFHGWVSTVTSFSDWSFLWMAYVATEASHVSQFDSLTICVATHIKTRRPPHDPNYKHCALGHSTYSNKQFTQKVRIQLSSIYFSVMLQQTFCFLSGSSSNPRWGVVLRERRVCVCVACAMFWNFCRPQQNNKMANPICERPIL